jgi:putative hemolysin
MPTTAVLTQDCERLNTSTPLFRLSLAQNIDDLIACQRLRYQVFNCELGEGFADSHATGLDRDGFDVVCDHLMVHDSATGMLVGTYRMQTGYRAQGNLGYYSAQLFDLTPFEPIRGEILELGRACVHQDYRTTTALSLLWKGIASYATLCNARYLIGCSSLSSQDQNEGLALYRSLRDKYSSSPTFAPFRIPPRAASKPANPSRLHAPRVSFAPTSKFLAASAALPPSTRSSAPSISSPWSISTASLIASAPASSKHCSRNPLSITLQR